MDILGLHKHSQKKKKKIKQELERRGTRQLTKNDAPRLQDVGGDNPRSLNTMHSLLLKQLICMKS